ncbi:VOC family protein [bacterium]|nr:VOC family protein [bacterium]
MSQPMKHGEPTIAIGHFSLRVSDLARSAEFYLSLGMREAHHRMRNLAILELRGGTHLLLFAAKKKPAAKSLPFDFLVDDVDLLQRALKEKGYRVGPMMRDRFGPHRTFSCPDPDGHVLTFTSEHEDEAGAGES